MDPNAFNLAAELFQGITLVKTLVAVFMVLALSVTAEWVSPKFAGILSGYPLGGAISLFFIGYEISPEFAAESAVYTILGLAATQGFAYGYYRISRRFARDRAWTNIVLAGFGGIASFGAVIPVLQKISVTRPAALAVAVISLLVFNFLFRRIENLKIIDRTRLGIMTLMARAVFAAAIIIFITAAAKLVGPRWSGLLSAFPITLFPFLVIIHVTYSPAHVWTIIKNVPRGLGALLIYSMLVSLVYPTWGLLWGTLAAYALATVYLVLINLNFQKKPGNPQGKRT